MESIYTNDVLSDVDYTVNITQKNVTRITDDSKFLRPQTCISSVGLLGKQLHPSPNVWQGFTAGCSQKL